MVTYQDAKDVSRQAAIDAFFADPAHVLAHCRMCGEPLSANREENLVICAKIGPLIFHRVCTDILRLNLQYYLD